MTALQDARPPPRPQIVLPFQPGDQRDKLELGGGRHGEWLFKDEQSGEVEGKQTGSKGEPAAPVNHSSQPCVSSRQLYPFPFAQISLCPDNRITQAVTATSPPVTLLHWPISIMLNELLS